MAESNYKKPYIFINPGFFTDKGAKAGNEDRVAIFGALSSFADDSHSFIFRRHYYAIYSVFDGHGGAVTAEFLASQLHLSVLEKLRTSEDFSVDEAVDSAEHVDYVKRALVEAFRAADAECLLHLRAAGKNDGATAVVCLVVDDVAWVANVGDARAVMLRNRGENDLKVKELSKIHKPNFLEERRRIEKSGGFVSDGRVLGKLAVSRSFGDPTLKQYGVSTTPHVSRVVLDREKDEFILLGCDGLWAQMAPKDSADFVFKKLRHFSNPDPNEVCRALVKEAVIDRGSTDNVTAVLLRFSKPGLDGEAKSDNLPNILFYGPAGSGKNTLLNALLVEIFGESAAKLIVSEKEIKVSPSKTIDFKIESSNYHVRLNPGASGINDKVIIQDTIKSIASTQSLTAHQKSFKVVVIDEAESLSKNAQHALRRTMEKYTKSTRIVLVCENINRLIDPLVSRCLCFRVPAPSDAETSEILHTICRSEHLAAPSALIARISAESEGNLKKALLSLETCYIQNNENFENFSESTSKTGKPGKLEEKSQSIRKNVNDEKTCLFGWEEYIRQVSLLIKDEQSGKRLMAVRAKVYVLLDHLIPPRLILKRLAMCLTERCDFGLQKEVLRLAALYEERMLKGSKPIFHLEAFVAKFMSVYKKWREDCFGE